MKFDICFWKVLSCFILIPTSAITVAVYHPDICKIAILSLIMAFGVGVVFYTVIYGANELAETCRNKNRHKRYLKEADEARARYNEQVVALKDKK